MEDTQLRLIQGEDGQRRRGGRGRRPAQRTLWALDADARARGLAGVRRAKLVLEATKPPEDHLRRAS